MLSTWKYRIIDENGKVERGKYLTDMSASEICRMFEREGKEVVYLEKVELITVFNFVKNINNNMVSYA